MPSNKDRLYVALHARAVGVTMPPDVEKRYHWALVIGPKKEKDGLEGIRIHARNVVRPGGFVEWECQQVRIHLTATGSSLVRIRIAKIVDTARLLDVLRAIPVRPQVPGWNCVSWVQEALYGLRTLQQAEGILGRGVVELERVRNTAMDYVNKKAAEGRFSQPGNWDASEVPTWDMIENRETTP